MPVSNCFCFQPSQLEVKARCEPSRLLTGHAKPKALLAFRYYSRAPEQIKVRAEGKDSLLDVKIYGFFTFRSCMKVNGPHLQGFFPQLGHPLPYLSTKDCSKLAPTALHTAMAQAKESAS